MALSLDGQFLSAEVRRWVASLPEGCVHMVEDSNPSDEYGSERKTMLSPSRQKVCDRELLSVPPAKPGGPA